MGGSDLGPHLGEQGDLGLTCLHHRESGEIALPLLRREARLVVADGDTGVDRVDPRLIVQVAVHIGARLPRRRIIRVDVLVILAGPQANTVDRDADGGEERELATGSAERDERVSDRTSGAPRHGVRVDRLRQGATATRSDDGLGTHEGVQQLGVTVDLAGQRALVGEGGLDPSDALLARLETPARGIAERLGERAEVGVLDLGATDDDSRGRARQIVGGLLDTHRGSGVETESRDGLLDVQHSTLRGLGCERPTFAGSLTLGFHGLILGIRLGVFLVRVGDVRECGGDLLGSGGGGVERSLHSGIGCEVRGAHRGERFEIGGGVASERVELTCDDVARLSELGQRESLSRSDTAQDAECLLKIHGGLLSRLDLIRGAVTPQQGLHRSLR